ncbi:MAG: hypothetical protein Q4Q37_08635, partial [Methanobrevibacter sp.]|nr:hypothetical protein [Methanobrevibacter sp.]
MSINSFLHFSKLLNIIFKVVYKLFSSGYTDEKQIIKMQMSDISNIKGSLSSREIEILIEL